MGLGSFVGNLTGGLLGTSDAEQAASDAKVLSAEARGEILGELDTSWGDIQGYLEPWLREGQSALSSYKQAIGAQPDAPVFEGFSFDPKNIGDSPAYQFIKDQGLQAVNRSMAAGRGLGSGNRMTAIADYMGGVASTEVDNEFRRQLQQYQTREQAKAGNFDARNLLSNQRISNFGNLTTMGQNTATNLASLRDRLSSSRAGAWSNYAAEQTAANLIPAQEKQSFINNAIGTAGTYFGMKG